jgi:hypothetical protein
VGAETSDFIFNRRDLEILSEDHVRHVPWYISYHEQSFGLEAFNVFDIGGRSRSPELYAVGSDRFGDILYFSILLHSFNTEYLFFCPSM